MQWPTEIGQTTTPKSKNRATRTQSAIFCNKLEITDINEIKIIIFINIKHKLSSILSAIFNEKNNCNINTSCRLYACMWNGARENDGYNQKMLPDKWKPTTTANKLLLISSC